MLLINPVEGSTEKEEKRRTRASFLERRAICRPSRAALIHFSLMEVELRHRIINCLCYYLLFSWKTGP